MAASESGQPAVQQRTQVATQIVLEEAMQGLRSVSKAEVVELKSFAKPPQAVKLVMEAVCVLMGCAPTWAESKRLLCGASFLSTLATFDRDSVSPARLRKLRKYLRMQELVPEAVKKVSTAAEGLMRWLLGMAAYASIRTGVEIELAVAPLPAPVPVPAKQHAQVKRPATAGDSLPVASESGQPAVQQRTQVAAQIVLEEAMQGLRSVSKAEVVELKSFAKPPQAVKLVMEAVCVLMGCAPTWAESKRLLCGASFLSTLATFDRDSVSPARLRKLRKYLRMQELVPEAVKKVSTAAEGLMRWLLGMAAYASIRTGVEIELAVAPLPAPVPVPAKQHAQVKRPAKATRSTTLQRPKSAPISSGVADRPPWDDGRPKKPQPGPMPSRAKVVWANDCPHARDLKAADAKAVVASSSSTRLSHVSNPLALIGAVEQVATQLNALSRVVHDMSVRVGVVEQLITT